jgi:outer membrane protein OmpA-like peptidoglycan-associated protein
VQDTRQGFWGKLNPFARKKYVQKQMTPIRDRVNELDELTSNNSKMIKDVDQRATEGIRQAHAKADEADQHAVQANQSAQQANQTAQEATNRLTSVQQVVSNVDQYKPVTETEIRFRPGQAVLSKKAKDALDQMATPLANQRGYLIEVQGFSPGRGQASVQDSQALAQSVVRYLVLQHSIPVYRIYVLGMGNAPSQATTEQAGTKARAVRGRRVEVALLKNDLEQLNAQPSAPGSTSGQGGVSGTTAQPSTSNPPPAASSQPSKPSIPPTL